MIATTIASQRSLNLVVLAAGRRLVSSATTKQLTQAVGAVAKDRYGEGGKRYDDDRASHEPQAATRGRDSTAGPVGY
jgi:D-serine deaminase-like pyridoxal phosphate-dependent protein